MSVKIDEKNFYLDAISKLKKHHKALSVELGIVSKSMIFCNNAIAYYEREIRLLELVAFCNTGKYPDDAR